MRYNVGTGIRYTARNCFLPILSVLLVAACAEQSKYSPRDEFTEPLREETRRSIQTLGVMRMHTDPEGDFDLPLRGVAKSTAAGTAGGALLGAAEGLRAARDPIGLIVLVPVGAVVGAITGGVSSAALAVPEKKAIEIEAHMTRVLSRIDAQAEVYRAVLSELRKNTSYGISEFEDAQEIDGNAQRETRQASENIDAILEVDTRSLGIVGRVGPDPLLRLFLVVRARLSEKQAGKQFYAHTFSYLGPARAFTVWGMNEATPLRDEITHALRFISERIVDEMFLEWRSGAASD